MPLHFTAAAVNKTRKNGETAEDEGLLDAAASAKRGGDPVVVENGLVQPGYDGRSRQGQGAVGHQARPV
jgi:hypothetical protein